MLKSLFLSLLLATGIAVAAPQSPKSAEKEEAYVSVPTPDLKAVPKDHTIVVPSPEGAVPGTFYLWCNNMRGTGMIALALDGQTVLVAIDCPENIKTDI